MTQQITNVAHPLDAATGVHDAGTAATASTIRLLACGVIAGPLFVVVALAQALTRPGFDLTRHPVSMLGLGSQGWVQNANFLLTGLLTIACAAGLRRALRSGPGGRWTPVLTAVYGAGFAAAGVFHTDPGNGFPPGAPAGIPATISPHGMLHMLFGSVAFFALIAVCFVLARRFAVVGQRAWAAGSLAAGLLFAVGLAEAMFGGPVGSLTLFTGAGIALLWVAATAARLSREATARTLELRPARSSP